MHSTSPPPVCTCKATLTGVVKTFKKQSQRLYDIYWESVQKLNEICKILETEAAVTEAADDSLLKQINSHEISNAILQLRWNHPFHLHSSDAASSNPCIVVVGQTNCGKSTFINTLLEQYVVPQDMQKCTARMIHLTYSKANFVRLRNLHGDVVPQSYRSLLQPRLPADLSYLNEADRLEEKCVSLIVEGGVDVTFLSHGVDVIDSPGLNQSQVLNDLVKTVVTGASHFIIYVIEGTKALTVEDIEDIRFLKETRPNLQIIYFVTKLDVSQRCGRRRSHQVSDSLQAQNRLQWVFQQLKQNGFIPEMEDLDTCQVFYGASLWRVRDFHEGGQPTAENVLVRGFEKMKVDLASTMSKQLSHVVENVALSLVQFNQSILEKIIKRASSIFDDTQMKLTAIRSIEEEEKKLFDSILSFLKRSEKVLKKKLMEMLNGNQERLLQALELHQYPVSFGIPASGVVPNVGVFLQCQKSISSTVCVALDTELKHFLESEVLMTYSRAEELLSVHHAAMSKTSYESMLQSILYSSYKAQSSLVWTTFVDACDNIKKTFWNILGIKQNPTASGGLNVNVHDVAWKRRQAQSLLGQLNKGEVAGKLAAAIRHDIGWKHEIFCQALEMEKGHAKLTVQLSEENRKQIVKMAPDFAMLFSKALAIRQKRALHGLKLEETLGEGAEGVVHRCNIRGEMFALKTATCLPNKWGNVALEIYFASTMHHPHLLPLRGVKLKSAGPNHLHVQMLMNLMKTTAEEFLPSKKLPLVKRLQLAQQISDAVNYLHDHNIMHRDLKLSNILIDFNENAVVADYGFMKNVSLNMDSFVGTPVCIAPEIVRREFAQSLKVDVYSFGVVLWYLVDGKGRDPKYTKHCDTVDDVLMAIATHGARPERGKHIDKKIWLLMNECWRDDPQQRPSMKEVKKMLTEIVESMK